MRPRRAVHVALELTPRLRRTSPDHAGRDCARRTRRPADPAARRLEPRPPRARGREAEAEAEAETEADEAPKPLPAAKVVSQTVVDGSTVGGVVDWRAHTIGPIARLQFVVDGTVLATTTQEPWSTSWDTTAVPAGAHVLSVRALAKDGRVAASATVSVTVEQPQPAAAPAAPPP